MRNRFHRFSSSAQIIAHKTSFMPGFLSSIALGPVLPLFAALCLAFGLVVPIIFDWPVARNEHGALVSSAMIVLALAILFSGLLTWLRHHRHRVVALVIAELLIGAWLAHGRGRWFAAYAGHLLAVSCFSSLVFHAVYRA
jgi:hypothetical protein